MLKVASKVVLFTVAVVFGAMFVGCGPKYPNCENDEHCVEKGEYCVNQLCRECANNDNCVAKTGDKCKRCGVNYTCEKTPGCCHSDADCPGGKCRKDGGEVGKCGPLCINNSECPAGQECVGERCVTPKVPCGGPCPAKKQCVNDRCEWECSFGNILFDFDKSNLRKDAKESVKANLDCLKKLDLPIVLAGHADERGEDQYNYQLAEQRWKSVQRNLKDLGIKVQMRGISYGEDRPLCSGSTEDCWQQNRRVEIQVDEGQQK